MVFSNFALLGACRSSYWSTPKKLPEKRHT
jgi:hypothetical protein